MARTHDLKVWPEPFAALRDGSKTFEFRKDDRGYMVGDVLRLKHWDPGKATNGDYVRLDGAAGFRVETIEMVVTYVLHGGRFGVPEGYVVMSIAPTPGASQ